MLSLVVLISGGGSNLRALLDAVHTEGSPVRIVAIGADREAEGFAHARHFDIPTFVVAPRDYADRDAWGEALLAEIVGFEPDVVILSGFMRLLPAGVVDALSPRVLNTHPAFLPEFPGAHAVRDALAAGATETGASLIVVDAGVDSGPIVAQERVSVLPDDTEATLHDRIKTVERRLLVQAVLDLADHRLDLEELT